MANNSINQLIPINDTNSKAFNELFDRLGTLDLTVLLIYLIDNVEASALSHLGEQFHVMGYEGWIFGLSDTEKRDLIKNAVQIHKYKGTKFAIRKVFESLNIEGQVSEWFEYDGDPFHFKIRILLNDRPYNSTTFKNLKNMVEEYKNIRSVLEEISIESQFTMQPNWASYTNAENEVVIS